MKPEDLLSIHPLFADRVRLSIMVSIAMSETPVTFTDLVEKLELTRGNLSSHMSKLEDESLVKIKKEFIDRKPCTTLHCTEKGRKEIKNYLSIVEGILKKAKF